MSVQVFELAVHCLPHRTTGASDLVSQYRVVLWLLGERALVGNRNVPSPSNMVIVIPSVKSLSP